ncbi:MAG: Thiosulfate sulfurtransferase, rhodanese, partial [uncultured Solirubrobacteraceae bacterium]
GRLREGRPGRHPVGAGPSRGREHPHRRGRRELGALRRGAHPGSHRLRLEDRPAGPGQARLPRRGVLRQAVRLEGHLQRPHGRPLRGSQQLVRGLHVLVPQVLRPRRRQADERPAREVAGRGPSHQHRRPVVRAHHLRGQAGRRRDPGQARRGALRARHRHAPGRRPVAAGVLRRADRHAGLRAGGRPARRPHPRRGVDPVGAGGHRGRHLQVRRPARGALRLQGRHRHGLDHRLLPHRRALGAHLVRAARAAGQGQRQELRRLVDRMGQPGRRAGREGRL